MKDIQKLNEKLTELYNRGDITSHELLNVLRITYRLEKKIERNTLKMKLIKFIKNLTKKG